LFCFSAELIKTRFAKSQYFQSSFADHVSQIILDVLYGVTDLVVIVLSGNDRMRYHWIDFERKPNATELLEESKWDVEELRKLAQWCQEDLYPGVSVPEELDKLRKEAEGRRGLLALKSEMDWSE
jgi:hypothetical protein